jgi:hypothetical protein
VDSPLKEGKAWAFAFLLSLPVLLLPIYNPDLFWHLSAGRWMIEHRAWLRADFLSFTADGAQWLDFEWLSQLIFQLGYCLAGFAGLWLLKACLLAVCGLLVSRVLELNGLSGVIRAAAFALWSLGALGSSDIRPELFSLHFTSALLYLLEVLRLGRHRVSPASLAWVFFIFVLWSNLHAGFPFGLVLMGIYGLVFLAEQRWGEVRATLVAAVTGVLGTVCNPYGLGPYQVIWSHWLMRGELSRYIKEWHPLNMDNPLHWPIGVLLALFGIILLIRLWTQKGRSLPWAPVLSAAFLAMSALGHTRAGLYFNSAGVAAVFLLAHEAGWLAGESRLRKTVLSVFLVCAGFLAWLVCHISWAGFFNYKYVPRGAAEFMARERATMEGLRIFNQWEWGGYLGWRLYPWYKVFCDGRYIFHSQLAETAQAASNPGLWQKYLEEKRIQGALLLNLELVFPTRKTYPDGQMKTFMRPWYLFYLPRERWALVYWDNQALLFLERKSVPSEWLLRHEYRYLLPKDGPAFQEALRLGEIPPKKFSKEQARWRAEVEAFPFR